MTSFARSLIAFQQRFGDEGEAEPSTDESAGWERQTSVAAGTLMRHFKPPLAIWFWAAYPMATHSNGIFPL